MRYQVKGKSGNAFRLDITKVKNILEGTDNANGAGAVYFFGEKAEDRNPLYVHATLASLCAVKNHGEIHIIMDDDPSLLFSLPEKGVTVTDIKRAREQLRDARWKEQELVYAALLLDEPYPAQEVYFKSNQSASIFAQVKQDYLQRAFGEAQSAEDRITVFNKKAAEKRLNIAISGWDNFFDSDASIFKTYRFENTLIDKTILQALSNGELKFFALLDQLITKLSPQLNTILQLELDKKLLKALIEISLNGAFSAIRKPTAKTSDIHNFSDQEKLDFSRFFDIAVISNLRYLPLAKKVAAKGLRSIFSPDATNLFFKKILSNQEKITWFECVNIFRTYDALQEERMSLIIKQFSPPKSLSASSSPSSSPPSSPVKGSLSAVGPFFGKTDSFSLWLTSAGSNSSSDSSNSADNSPRSTTASTSSSGDESATETDLSSWFKYKDLLIHAGWFLKGFVVVVPNFIASTAYDTLKIDVSSETFDIEHRNLRLLPTGLKGAHERFKKTKELYQQMLQFALENNPKAIFPLDPNTVPSITNDRHKEELFLSLILKPTTTSADDTNGMQDVGLYMYPWLSLHDDNHRFEFSGFSKFVVAVCMFGSTLKAIDERGCEFPFMKHNRKFFETQKIHGIDYNALAANPYEQMVFSEFEKWCYFVNAFSKPRQKKELVCHLPHWDYVLFALGLYIDQKMTFPALLQFLDVIFVKSLEYWKKIKSISKQHGIEVTILSPFDNLFSDMSSAFTYMEGTSGEPKFKKIFIEFVFHTLLRLRQKLDGEPQSDKRYNLSRQQDQEEILSSFKNEGKFVEVCLNALQQKENVSNEELGGVWHDFGTVEQQSKNKVVDIEGLLRAANAVTVAFTAKGSVPNTVCSVCELTEKQIEVAYSQFSKAYGAANPGEKNPYVSICNTTIIDPCIPYSLTTKGTFYYFSNNEATTLSKLMTKNILRYAYGNVGLFAGAVSDKVGSDKSETREPLSIETFLTRQLKYHPN